MELKRFVAFAVLAILVGWSQIGDRVVLAVTPDSDGCAHSSDLPSPDAMAEGRSAVLCLLNARRAEHGLPPLVEEARLEAAAQRHAEDMSRRNFFAHDNPESATPDQRMRQAGFDGQMTGENLYWGSGSAATPAAAIEGWMKSPGHRANILRPEFRWVGTGMSDESPERGIPTEGGVWVNNFGG